jgi:hypothetical protein
MENNTREESGVRITAIIVGWVIAEAIGFIFGLIAGQTIGDFELLEKLIYFVIGPIGALVGGYVAGDMSKNKIINHGRFVGILSIFFAMILSLSQGFGFSDLYSADILLSWVMIFFSGSIGDSFAKKK